MSPSRAAIYLHVSCLHVGKTAFNSFIPAFITFAVCNNNNTTTFYDVIKLVLLRRHCHHLWLANGKIRRILLVEINPYTSHPLFMSASCVLHLKPTKANLVFLLLLSISCVVFLMKQVEDDSTKKLLIIWFRLVLSFNVADLKSY